VSDRPLGLAAARAEKLRDSTVSICRRVSAGPESSRAEINFALTVALHQGVSDCI